jgi:hypothetical protein
MVRLHGEGVDWRKADIDQWPCTLAEEGGAMDGEPMVLL